MSLNKLEFNNSKNEKEEDEIIDKYIESMNGLLTKEDLIIIIKTLKECQY